MFSLSAPSLSRLNTTAKGLARKAASPASATGAQAVRTLVHDERDAVRAPASSGLYMNEEGMLQVRQRLQYIDSICDDDAAFLDA
jgi:hypothetical protein